MFLLLMLISWYLITQSSILTLCLEASVTQLHSLFPPVGEEFVAVFLTFIHLSVSTIRA